MTNVHELITAEADYSGFCVVCGLDNDTCPKHGPADREGTKVLDNHDRGDHTGCNPKGCPLAGTVTGRAAPGWNPDPVTTVPTTPVARWDRVVTAADLRGETVPSSPHVEVATEVPSVVTWEEPERPSRFTWTEHVKALKSNPGHWARIIEAPTRVHANRARNALRYHGAETKTKKTGDTEVTVWAKWPTDAKETS